MRTESSAFKLMGPFVGGYAGQIMVMFIKDKVKPKGSKIEL